MLSQRSPRIWISLVGISFALLSLQACIQPRVLLDPQIPHRVASPASVDVWANDGAGKLIKVRTVLEAGWYVASPRIVEP